MPKLKQYTRQFSLDGTNRVRRATAADFGGGIGQAGAEALNAVANTALDYAERERRRAIASEQSAIRRYTAQQRLLLTQSLTDQAQNAMPEGGEGFTDNFSATMEESLSSSAPTVQTEEGRQMLAETQAELRSVFGSRAIGEEATAAGRFRIKQVEDTIGDNAAYLQTTPGDFEKLTEELDQMLTEQGITSPNDRAMLRESAVAKYAEAALDGIITREPDAAIEQISSGRWDDVLSAEQKRTILRRANSRVEELDRETMIDQSFAYNELFVRVATGEATQQDIDNFAASVRRDARSAEQIKSLQIAFLREQERRAGTQTDPDLGEFLRSTRTPTTEAEIDALDDELRTRYADGDFTDTQYAEIGARLDTARSELGNDILYVDNVNRALSDPTVALDHTDRRQMEAVDTVYQGIIERAQEGGENVVARTVGFVTATGVIPTSLVTNIANGLAAQDPATVAQSAIMLEQLYRSNPMVASTQLSLDSGRLSYGTAIAEYTRWGLSPEEAVTRANESLQITDSQRQTRRDAFAILRRDTTPADLLASRVSDEPGDTPSITPAAQADFARMMQLEYEKYGDYELAETSAYNLWRRSYQPSMLMSPSGNLQYGQFSPEMAYGLGSLSPEENAEWMREQLQTDIVADGALFDIQNMDSMYLTRSFSHDTLSGKPTYIVSYVDPAGTIQYVANGEGDPMLWTPDYETSPAGQRAAAAHEREIHEARLRREAQAEGLQGGDINMYVFEGMRTYDAERAQ